LPDPTLQSAIDGEDLAEVGTRERLLVAAGEVFAANGYHNTTIRDICTRAGANVAAVNYHFQGKEGLYAAVVEYAHSCAMQQSPRANEPAAPATDQLRWFIRNMMHRLLDEGRPAWHAKLMAREMIDPTVALDRLVSISIRPQFEALARIVDELLGGGADPVLVRRTANSVLGQCLLHRHCRPVLDRLFPEASYSPAEVAALADHITSFSLGAIAGIAALASTNQPGAAAGTSGLDRRT